jgi:hypothetical protein
MELAENEKPLENTTPPLESGDEAVSADEPKDASTRDWKRPLALGLLVLCNILAAVALGTFTPPVEVSRADLTTIDVTIDEKLKEYNIPSKSIRTETVKVDSVFTRKVVRAGIPRGISKTMLHLELQHELGGQGVKLPATVKFPSKELNIHFMLDGTIVRTLVLRTDTSLKALSYPGTVVFFTDPSPDSDALEELRNYGETVLIAAKIESVSDAEQFAKSMKGFTPSRLLLWVLGTENTDFRFDRFYTELTEQLKKSNPHMRLLMFNHASLSGNKKLWKILQQQNWSVVMADPDRIEPGNMDEEAFKAFLDRFNREALTGKNTVALLPMKTSYTVWLKQGLLIHKKNGLRLVEAKSIKL